jgi:hypothetical protein
MVAETDRRRALAGSVVVILVRGQSRLTLSVQLDVPIAQALVRLRAYAFGHDRRLTEVAEDVVGRRLRFYDRDDGEYRTI